MATVVRRQGGSKIREGLACDNLNVQTGEGVRQVCHSRDQPFRRERWRDAQDDLRAFWLKLLRSVFNQRQSPAYRIVISAAVFGEEQSAGLSMKKLHPEVGFQSAYLLGHRALRHVEFVRCQAEVQMPGGSIEHLQGVKVRQAHWNSALRQ